MSDLFQNEILKANFAGVQIEKVDDNTIKFILEKPNIFFVTNLTTGILPMHILKDVDPAELLQNELREDQPISSRTEAYPSGLSPSTVFLRQASPRD